ncbi:MAG: carboxypeptidase regulatory-like domain-containing protein, partial [Planctomycetes bacterium]|nr:carboxypeptidase regulatory-like domain-containing protein [Planctomycetota bacterium]
MARFLLITVLLALLGLGAVTVMRGFGGQGETRLDQSATDLESPDDPIVHRRVASDSGEPIESRATTPADRPERTAVVSGRLRSDRGEDLPGAGITLVATPLGDATAGVQTKVVTTNAYGAFEAKGIVRPSLLEVVCRPLTHQVVRQRMMLPDQDSLDLGNIICESGAGLSGVVVDASGVPVADAEVLVEEPATGKTPQQLLRPSEILGRTKTADDGRFSLRGLPSGAAHLVVKSETHPTGEVDVEGLRVGFDLEDVVVQLPLGRVVSGRVVDEQGQAIEGASLVALNAGSALGVLVGQPEVRSAQSDAEGRFRFEGLRLADLRFDAWHPGFLRAAGVAVPAEVAFFQVEMRRAPWVFGQLLGPQGPIGRAARLQAVDGSLGSQSYTEPEILLGTAAAEALGIESEPGLYAVVGLTGQAVTLLFEAPGCVRQQVPLLELPPGEGFRLDMKLKAATPVRGQVVDSRTGAGIADAIVRGGRLGTGRRLSTAESLSAELRALLGPMNEQRASLPERVETRSDAEGNFQLDGLDVAQGVEVTARHPEFLASEPVKASGTEELTLSLTRGAVLQGQVWNPRRDPAVGARVVVRASGT